MAFPRIANSFISITINSASSEATGFTRERIALLDKPSRTARTTVTTDSWYVIDLGTDYTNITVQLENTNYTQYRFQESSDNTASPPSWDDLHTTQTINKTDGHSMRRAVVDLTLATKRYIRLFIPSQTPVDGASYLETGSVVMTDSIVTLPEGIPQSDFRYSVQDANVHNTFANGNFETINRNIHNPLLINVSYETGVEQNFIGTDYTQWFDLTNDSSSLILLDMNLGNNSQSFLGKFIGEISTEFGGNSGTAKYVSRTFRVVN